MKKALALAFLAMVALNTAAKADDAWFDRYDRNHDGHWNYEEFKRAHNDYWKHHRNEQRYNDEQLRAQYNTWEAEHKGWVDREQVRGWHHW